jgi:hypothetical protein
MPFTAFGIEFPDNTTELDAHLYCFRHSHRPEYGGLGKAAHFRRCCELLWGPDSPRPFIWHPWAEWMLKESCRQKYLSVLGAGSSGKTVFFAVWAIVNWLANPLATKVMVTSTSLKESRKRIWGAVREYYMAAQGAMPGKLVDSQGIIKLSDEDDPITSEKAGIELIAGERKKEKEAIGKLIGIKNDTIIFIADELPELSEAILQAAFSNLTLNPHFQLVGIGNFNSVYDPLGVLSRPKNGYSSINQDMDEWETERGWCIRLDGIKSPNIIAGRDIWPIYGSAQLAEHKKMGENTAAFWRMCRSFPCPEGEEHTIFSDADFIAGKAQEPATWVGSKIRLAAFDPGYTTGGDRSAAVFGWLGMTTDGKMTLAVDPPIIVLEDLRKTDETRSYQIAKQFMLYCQEPHRHEGQKIQPENVAIDSTGAGIPFSDILCELWSPKIMQVQFGSKPSELPVSANDARRCCDAYSNKVTELWYGTLPFIQAGQIKTLPEDIIKELKARRYDTVKSVGLKVLVEPKKDMKERIGKSPDLADAFALLVELARHRHGFIAEGMAESTRSRNSWLEVAKKYDSFNDNEELYLPSEQFEDRFALSEI